MRRLVPQPLYVLIVVALLMSIMPPAAGAQGEDCPEGLVYDAAGDICVLPENLPPQEEAPPEEEAPVEEEPVEEPVDEAPVDEEPVDEEPVDEEPVDEGDGEMVDPAADAPTLAGDPAAQIKNLTLLTFACPINWDPATRPIESSREMCTEPIVPNMSYTVLFEGEFLGIAAFGGGLDLALEAGVAGAPLPPGMYTIREDLQPGLEDPFAFCAIYAADGSTRLTVQETVRGGSLDILLAAGEEVNCEWFSVATVPEAAAPPSLGLEVKAFSCPAPAEFSGGLEDCTLPLPGPVTFEAIYGGQVIATATLDSTEFPNEIDQEAPSGEWTIRPLLAEGWVDPHFTCDSVDYVGTYIGDARDFPPVDGSLGVTVQVNPDQRVRCNIWVFAGDVRESVVVVTRGCPDAIDAATLSPGVRTATCRRMQFQEISITVDEAAPVPGESTRNGVAVFPTQPGLWRIAVNPGLGVVGQEITFVTCDHTIAALGQVQTIEPTINSDRRSVSIELDEGDALRCDYFFGPESAASGEAPAPPPAEEAETATEAETTEPEAETTEPEAETTEPEAETTEPEAETTEPEAETTQPEAETTGDTTTAPDAAPEGGETAPEGGSGSFGGGGETVQVVDTGAQDDDAATDPTDPATEGTASLAIQHWDCAEAIAPEATVDSLLETCVASLAPSGWVLNGNPLEVADGYATWETLPLEPAVVGNGAALGKDDAASAVYCSLALTNVDEPLIGVEAAVQDGTIELVFDQPSVVYCNWFLGP